jgi:hypothetical protein
MSELVQITQDICLTTIILYLLSIFGNKKAKIVEIKQPSFKKPLRPGGGYQPEGTRTPNNTTEESLKKIKPPNTGGGIGRNPNPKSDKPIFPKINSYDE